MFVNPVKSIVRILYINAISCVIQSAVARKFHRSKSLKKQSRHSYNVNYKAPQRTKQKMRPLIIIGIFGLVSYIGLSHSAPVLVKKDFQKGINSTAVLKMTSHVLYRRDAIQLLRNQIKSARHHAEDLFHEYVQASASLPDGYEITEREVLNIFPQVDYTVSQIFSLHSAAALLRQLTESVTSLRPAIANTLTVEGLPIDGRLLDHLEELAGQMNQILYRLPATSNNLPALIVTNLDSDDQKRVMAILSVTKYFLEYLIRNV